jgi:MFS family permease
MTSEGPSAPRAADRLRIYAAALLRASSTGMTGVLLGFHLSALGLDAGTAGFVVGAGLAGGALAALAATVAGDRWGRRRFLVGLALLGGAGLVVVALGTAPAVVGAAALLGMVNGMGRDRGAALVLEQAVLPTTTPDAERTRAFAWYNVLQDVGHALGALLAVSPSLLRRLLPLDEAAALRLSLLGAALLVLPTALLYRGLSPAVETALRERGTALSASSRGLVARLAALFGLDSLGGGFLTAALVALFFHERFGATAETVAPLFFGARVLNAVSHLAAAWLARRIGLLQTMVFTHIPSSLLLATVAFAPSFPVAAVLFLLREGLVEMDVPTRQSYVMAVVRPEERTFASGVTHLVRLAGWAVAPPLAGLFMQGLALGAPLVAGAATKVTYDVLLYRAFRRVRPPEERPGGHEA